MTQPLSPLNIPVRSLDDLRAFAQKLAPLLQPGDVIALNGNLGAGKTTFIQLLCQALGISEKVVSPTFVLVHEYLSGKFPIIHADLYRLGTDKSDGLADEIFAFAQQGLVLVEWAEYGAFMDELATITLTIRVDPETEQRDIRLETTRKDLYEQLG